MAFDPPTALLSASSLFPKGRVLGSGRTQVCTKGSRDESAAEFGWVMGDLRRGVPTDEVQARLIDCARARRGADVNRYAALTVKEARKALGL